MALGQHPQPRGAQACQHQGARPSPTQPKAHCSHNVIIRPGKGSPPPGTAIHVRRRKAKALEVNLKVKQRSAMGARPDEGTVPWPRTQGSPSTLTFIRGKKNNKKRGR